MNTSKIYNNFEGDHSKLWEQLFMKETPVVRITYDFIMEEQRQITFTVNLDSQTLDYIPVPKKSLPDWTRLDYEPRCVDCILTNYQHTYCPLMVNLADVVVAFKDTLSYEVVDCKVTTGERTYLREKIPIQVALSSLLGIIMVTSGCVYLDKLRPMVKFHLPFASVEETIYRSASMYLLAQYFRSRKNLDFDHELTGLTKIYENIDMVNARICKRLLAATNKDASLNAVIVLDVFAKMVPMSIDSTLSAFENLFAGYLVDKINEE
ncbi:MAG: hypothetical protein ABIA75_03530 [Candidatus Neomarinimicrobiota bacterium]